MTTTPIWTCSTAPAEARQTAGVTRAALCSVTTTPVAPAPSALRQTAPRLCGIGHLVEARDQRPLARGELVGVRIPVRLAECDDALVVAVPGQLVQLPFALDVDAKARLVAEPRLGRERALGRGELEDLPAPGPDHLAHRAAPVDELAGQSFATSR